MSEASPPPAPPKKSKRPWILVGGIGLFLTCGCCCGVGVFLGEKERQADRKKFDEGNNLWTAGKKPEAVANYKYLIDQSSMEKSEKALMFQRIIDFDAEKGDTASITAMVEKAEKAKILFVLETEKGKTAFAAIQRERAGREAAEKAERDRQQAAKEAEKKKKEEERLAEIERKDQAKKDESDRAKKEAADRAAAELAEREKKAKAQLAEKERQLKLEQLKNERLTADYYPHKPGTSYFDYAQITLTGSPVAILHKIEQKDNGIIERTMVKTGVLSGFTPMWKNSPNEKEKYPQYHREKDGFIEIGDHIGETEQVYWRPELKLGTKVGDTWEWSTGPGDLSRYRVSHFFEDKGQLGCVIVIVAATAIGDKALITVTNVSYRKGIGKVTSRTVLKEGNKEKTTALSHRPTQQELSNWKISEITAPEKK